MLSSWLVLGVLRGKYEIIPHANQCNLLSLQIWIQKVGNKLGKLTDSNMICLIKKNYLNWFVYKGMYNRFK